MKKQRERRKSQERLGLNRTRPDENIRRERDMTRNLNRISCAILCLVLNAAVVPSARAQHGFSTPEDVIKYTPEWHGERFPDGRPKVPDDILDRMKRVTLEEAWAVLQQNGFVHQYEDGWLSIHEGKVLVGRALTATWMP